MAEKKAKVESQDTESSGADSSQALSQDLSPEQKLALSPELTKSPTLFDKIYDKVELERKESVVAPQEQYKDLQADIVEVHETVKDNIIAMEDKVEDALPSEEPEDKAPSGPSSPSKRLAHASPEKIFDKALSKKHKAKSVDKNDDPGSKQESPKPDAPERSGTFSSETKPADEGNVKWRSERTGSISRGSRASKNSDASNKERRGSKPKREVSIEKESPPKQTSRQNSNSSNKSVDESENINAEISTPIERPASRHSPKRQSPPRQSPPPDPDVIENDTIESEAEKLNGEIISQSEENVRAKLEQESNDATEEEDHSQKSGIRKYFLIVLR